jgi:hypothetical protein
MQYINIELCRFRLTPSTNTNNHQFHIILIPNLHFSLSFFTFPYCLLPFTFYFSHFTFHLSIFAFLQHYELCSNRGETSHLDVTLM